MACDRQLASDADTQLKFQRQDLVNTPSNTPKVRLSLLISSGRDMLSPLKGIKRVAPSGFRVFRREFSGEGLTGADQALLPYKGNHFHCRLKLPVRWGDMDGKV
jgi:hypothetical protein